MQKFYKYFTVATLSLIAFWLISAQIGNQTAQVVSAQNKQRDEACVAQNIFVIEDNDNRTVHMVYDFNRSTVSVVQIQKGYSPPEVTVRTRTLGQ